MNLYTFCKSCKKEIQINSNAATRPDLQMEKGDEFLVTCQNCGKKEKKHVNDIKAEPNKIILFSGFLLGISITVFLWFYFGAVGTVTGVIPVLIWRQQMS